MGTEWERAQREKLVAKQKKRILEMEKEIGNVPDLEMEPKKKLL